MGMENILIKQLQAREAEGLVRSQTHMNLPLIIWNYSEKCQFDKSWDEVTIQARGLITDKEGNIVARPFRKFFNLGENNVTVKDLPAEVPEITQKMDGSLGIQYYVNGHPFIATRGSFSSEQAFWATNWLRKRGFKQSDFMDGYTYLYEIIYPSNRIVVDYQGMEGCVLLAIVDNKTGIDLPFDMVTREAVRLQLGVPKRVHGSVEEIMQKLPSLDGNQEGFVVKYSNGYRVKMKGEEYVRLHRLMTSFSTKSIWECLMHGQDLSQVIKDVPDEFYAWINKKAKELQLSYETIYREAEKAYEAVRYMPTRKEQALTLLGEHNAVAGIVFSMLNKKPYSQAIWKMVEPKFEKPFTEEK